MRHRMEEKSNPKFLLLRKRQEIISTIRKDLYSQNFLEVETPLLVKHTTPDVHLDSILADNGYLITSTEYQVKRLIASGFPQVFTLTKNFRAHDKGRYHSPEFTMLEWGRAFQTLHDIEEDAVRFIQKAFRKLYPNQNYLTFNGNTIDFMTNSWERLTVRQAFEDYLGLKNLGNFSLENIRKASKEADIDLPKDYEDDLPFTISFLLDKLQTYLGKEKPTFLHEWPSFLTSSAPSNAKDPYTVERSELYIGGIEIANGFPFLRDPKIQKKLFEEQLDQRKLLGKPSVTLDDKYIEALSQLPEGAGMALGVDRLVMILTESSSLSDVQAFDWDDL